MKLTEETLKVLKNFSSINPSIIVKPGQTLYSITEEEHVVGIANVEEQFDRKFALFNLNEFLSVYGMFNQPELKFNDSYVDIEDSDSRVRYMFSNPSVLKFNQREVKMPNADLEVILTDDVIGQIRKASSVLGHAHLKVTGTAGESSVKLTVHNIKDFGANTYTTKVDAVSVTSDVEVTFLINNLKFIGGDYTLKISNRGITHWSNNNSEIEYYVAIEK